MYSHSQTNIIQPHSVGLRLLRGRYWQYRPTLWRRRR